ncbi:hypothetical protein [Devosia sp.]|uniref:hypothetical protein n=1 Tax=Devosia sp. TaxID=1871048 RepID=UPI002AFF1A53|nr:hypothetical protein [Devosia sp.]
MFTKRSLVTAILAVLALAVLAAFGLAMLAEQPLSNSYVQLAQGWLEGRFDTDLCVDGDCALFDGKTYIIFPPMPGVIALPFVALFGPGFAGFTLLAVLAFLASGWLWWRIFSQQSGSRDIALLLVCVVLFASPLAFVTLRGDHVWFFAQSWGFLFATAALYFALVKPNALLVGLFIGMAFLCRQMTILYLPVLYVLMLDKDRAWFTIDWAAIRRVMALSAFPLVAIAVYFAYNAARFGSPLETGYSYIFPLEWESGADVALFLRDRVRDLGIFSDQYFLFNFVYMFIAGPHVEFGGKYLTEMLSFDINGASLFLVTPALFFALLAPWNRDFWFAMGTVALILGLTLFYHSNGFSQYSAQRYALDWLPILLVLLARGVRPAHAAPLALLTGYSMAVTLSMLAFGRLLGVPG